MSDKWVGEEEKHRRPLSPTGKPLHSRWSKGLIRKRSSNKTAEWVCQLNQLVKKNGQKQQAN